MRIVDGDTVDMHVDLGFDVWKKERFRLYGINAPERFTAEGKAATAYLASILPVGAQVTIHTYKDAVDKYGRMLAEIAMGSVIINDTMIQANHAVRYMR